MARFRFPGNREVSGRLIELLDFDFQDVLILFSRFCGWVIFLGLVTASLGVMSIFSPETREWQSYEHL